MKIMDGVKLGIGLWIGKAIMKTLDDEVARYILDNEFESDFMKSVKKSLEDRAKPKGKRVDYQKVEVKGFRAD